VPSQDVTNVEVLLGDSVSTEVLQGFGSGSTPGSAHGNASTGPNDIISVCSQRVNESSLEQYTERSDMYICLRV
jgi:hypothetical protein